MRLLVWAVTQSDWRLGYTKRHQTCAYPEGRSSEEAARDGIWSQEEKPQRKLIVLAPWSWASSLRTVSSTFLLFISHHLDPHCALGKNSFLRWLHLFWVMASFDESHRLTFVLHFEAQPGDPQKSREVAFRTLPYPVTVFTVVSPLGLSQLRLKNQRLSVLLFGF